MNKLQHEDTVKRVVFTDTDKRHAELKIRLHYDNLRQTEFFRGLITGYIENDENVLKFIEKLKKQKNISKSKRNKVNKMHTEASHTIEKFGLNEGDIESIFDLLEQEHPEL